ncbi:MAG: hypothetical protein IIC32_00595 [Chloroflexi bacterium]|nr:hypothetical protein [Chloroflexota bacterium]
MNTKPVMLVIAVVAALAVAGGAFAGGIALGKSQANDAAEATAAADTQATGGTGALDLDALRQQFQSGDFDPDTFAQLQEQFGGQFGGGFGGGGGGFGGGTGDGTGGGERGLFGTIETIEGDTLTIDTARGPLQADVGPETTIQIFADGTLADLEPGMQVTVVSERAADGTVVATSITVVPEGGGGFGGRRLGGGQ